MLTLFHSPHSRSSAIVALVEEMGIADRLDLRVVAIPRADGTGRRDPANPHPEGKVPALVHDGRVITERGAIILHFCALFPEAGMAPLPGTPDWGAFAGWMAWYQGVLEPVLILQAAGVSHPYMTAAIRGTEEATARIRAALEMGPWLMGDSYSAADVLVHSPYAWFEDMTPDDPLIRGWVERCKARPSRLAVLERDLAQLKAVA